MPADPDLHPARRAEPPTTSRLASEARRRALRRVNAWAGEPPAPLRRGPRSDVAARGAALMEESADLSGRSWPRPI